MEYRAGKTLVIDPDIFSKEWDKAETGLVNKEMWEGFFPAPETTFKLLKGPKGLSVLMHTNERDLRAEETNENGSVFKDSCMEFFYKPSPSDLNFFNFEFNPKGVLHLAIGEKRGNRTLLFDEREIFSIESLAKDGDWTLKFYIPDEFVLKYVDKVAPVARGNFYKCGEETGHSHYAAWSFVHVPEPDYHVPDFFGLLFL